MDSINLKNSLLPKKSPPTAVLNLKNNTVIISQEEIEKKLKEESTVRRQIAYNEELKKANKPTSVFLSAYIRMILEDALGIISVKKDKNENGKKDGNFNDDNDEIYFQNQLKSLLRIIESSGVNHDSGVFSELQDLSSQKQSESVHNVIRDLRKQGFQNSVISQSLNSIIKTKKLDGKIVLYYNKKQEMNIDVLQFLVYELCIEFICLNIDDCDLPTAFDPRKNEQRETLEFYKKTNVAENKKEILFDDNKIKKSDLDSNDKMSNDGSGKNSTTNNVIKNSINTNKTDNTKIPVSNSNANSTHAQPTSSPPTQHQLNLSLLPILDNKKDLEPLILEYGWSTKHCHVALQIAQYLHTTSTTTSNTTVDFIKGPKSVPADLAPVGVTAVCVLWLATKCHTLAQTLPLSLLQSECAGHTEEEREKVKGIDQLMKSMKRFLSCYGVMCVNQKTKQRNNGNNTQVEVEVDAWEVEEEERQREEDVKDEIESLQSIYGDTVKYTKKENTNNTLINTKNTQVSTKFSHFFSMELERVEGEHSVCSVSTHLDVYVLPFMDYPTYVPVALVRNSGISDLDSSGKYVDVNTKCNSDSGNRNENKDNKNGNGGSNNYDVQDKESDDLKHSVLLSIQINILAKTKELIGSPCIFQIASHIEENLNQIVTSIENEKSEEQEDKVDGRNRSSSISHFLTLFFSCGVIDKDIESIFSAAINDSSDDNNTNNKNEMKPTLYQNATITDEMTTDNKEKNENVKDIESNTNSDKTSNESSISTSFSTLTDSSPSTSTKASETMSEITSNSQSINTRLKKQSKSSFWSVSENGKMPKTPKSSLYMKMLEGRKKLPAWRSR